MIRLVVATRNRDKFAEIAEILGGLDVELASLDDYPGAPDVDESGTTFAENAIKKAVSAAKYAGKPALADDSGLVVDALGGRPGVRSARYGGPGASSADRYLKLLDEMEHIPDGERAARFVCAVAVAAPDGRSWTSEGSVEGVITREPRGSGGFGYDPVFLVPDLGMTFAELGEDVKNRLSHRARALAKSIPLIREALGESV